MKIDSHQHFWRFDAARDSWITGDMAVLKRDFMPRDLQPELAANGMDRCVAVQASQSEEETLFLLDLAQRHDWIAGVVGWLDLRAENVIERLLYFSQFRKLRGLRHIVQAESDDRFMLRQDFQSGISSLAEFNLTFDILVYPRQLPAAVELVSKFPRQSFVLDHVAKPAIKAGPGAPENLDWARHIKAIAAQPNVYCKLSGLLTEGNWHRWRPEDFTPYLYTVFQAFGPDRLMFGSDWPVCLLAGKYSQVKSLITGYARNFPGAREENIFGANAARFYGLEN